MHVNILAYIESVTSAVWFGKDGFSFQFVVFYTYYGNSFWEEKSLHGIEKLTEIRTSCTRILLLKGH